MPATRKEDEARMYDRRARKHTGCLSLILLVLLALSLLACIISDGVQKVVGPIDEHGCRVDCRGCEFSRYEYQRHHCWCICDGIEIQLY